MVSLKPQYPHTNSPNWSPYISLKNWLRDFVCWSKIFTSGDCFNSHHIFSRLCIDIVKRWDLQGKIISNLVRALQNCETPTNSIIFVVGNTILPYQVTLVKFHDFVMPYLCKFPTYHSQTLPLYWYQGAFFSGVDRLSLPTVYNTTNLLVKEQHP